MDQILSKQHYRRTFFSLVALVLSIALVFRFFVVPYYFPEESVGFPQLLGSLLDNLVISLFLAVLIGCFLFWLTPEIVKRSAIEVIAPNEINPLLKSVTSDTQFWIYKGACGRYTRSITIPKLAEAARNKGTGRDITICILNPDNDALCEAYSTYRKSLKSGKLETVWTKEFVQEEVIATAVTALKYQYSEPLLRIRVFFVDHFSAFRFDISDKFVVITKEEKEAAALRADTGTYFYDSYRDDVRLTERQSKEMKYVSNLKFDVKVDKAKLFEALDHLDIINKEKLEKLNTERILSGINEPSNPYQ